MRLPEIREIKKADFLNNYKDTDDTTRQNIGVIFDTFYSQRDIKKWIRGVRSGPKALAKLEKLYKAYLDKRILLSQIEYDDSNGGMHLTALRQIVARDDLSDGQKETLGRFVVEQTASFGQVVGLVAVVNDYLPKLILENHYLGLLSRQAINTLTHTLTTEQALTDTIGLIETNINSLKAPEGRDWKTPKRYISKTLLPDLRAAYESSRAINDDYTFDGAIEAVIGCHYWLCCVREVDKIIARRLQSPTLLFQDIYNKLNDSIRDLESFAKDWNKDWGKQDGVPRIELKPPDQGDIDMLIRNIEGQYSFRDYGVYSELRLKDGRWIVRPIRDGVGHD